MKRFRLVAVWILQSLLAAFFAVQTVVKLGGSQAWITRFRAWGYPDHFYLVVGLAELFVTRFPLESMTVDEWPSPLSVNTRSDGAS